MPNSSVTAQDDASCHNDDAGASPLQQALHETSIMSDREMESVALLQEIFPDLTDEELTNLHRERLERANSASKKEPQSPFSSNLGQRLWNTMKAHHHNLEPPNVTLPDDFLRLPSSPSQNKETMSKAEPDDDPWQSQLMRQLEQRVLRQHREYQETRGGTVAYPLDDEYCYTRALSRDSAVGLGMTICEESGCIWVHSLLGRDGVRWFRAPPDIESGGPAIQAGIHPGDWLLGIQGEALLSTNHKHFLRHAVSSIQYADNPVVLHLQRVPFNALHPLAGTGPSLLDTTIESVDTSFSEESVSTISVLNGHSVARVHPFITAMATKGLIQNKKEERKANESLIQFTERARHWESASSFRIDASTFQLRPHFDPRDLSLPFNEDSFPFYADEGDGILSYAPSTPMLDPAVDSIPVEYLGYGTEGELGDQGLLGFQLDEEMPRTPSPRKQTRASYPGSRRDTPNSQPSDVFIPLMGVRKALCVRIVNTFLEEQRTAYTIWVYDVESGREWYAPVRYLSDFRELRSATAPLCRSIYKISFPSSGWLKFGVHDHTEPDSVRDAKCRQLENFIRALCTMVYTDELHPDIAEIAIHVQSFLGCESGLSQGTVPFLHLQNHVVNNESMLIQRLEEGHTVIQMYVRLLLKRSIQRYTYRLFLLDAMKRIVDDFVSKTRANGPTLKEIEALQAKGRDVLKARAMLDLGRIQSFLDQIQDLILENCAADFESIARRRDFSALQKFTDGGKGDAYLDKIVREAVREQIEIEIYVPLRSVVSRLLVNGWRHDDMEIHFKTQELRKRPQSMFKIPESEQSPSGWRSVSAILNDGVGRSTLPCAKLRAIVDAAKEITYVYSREQETSKGKGSSEQKSTLGADDFLPIFIYCVIQAEMDRPCALGVLLQTLCDQSSRIGETGYYLASFEIAISHIQELDLTLDRQTS